MNVKAVKKEVNRKTNVRATAIYKRLADPETGEIEYVQVSRKEIHYGQRPFLRLDAELFFELTDGIGKNSYRLLNYFLYKVGRFTNVCNKTGATIAKELSMATSSFDKAAAELKERKLIVSNGHKEWILNPSIGVYCDEESRESLQQRFDILAYGGKRKERGDSEHVD